MSKRCLATDVVGDMDFECELDAGHKGPHLAAFAWHEWYERRPPLFLGPSEILDAAGDTIRNDLQLGTEALPDPNEQKAV